MFRAKFCRKVQHYCQLRPTTIWLHILLHIPRFVCAHLHLIVLPSPSAVRKFAECQMKLKSTYVLSNEQGEREAQQTALDRS